MQTRRLVNYLIHYADWKCNDIGDIGRVEICRNSANSALLNKLTHSSQGQPCLRLKGKYFDFLGAIHTSAATVESNFHRNK